MEASVESRSKREIGEYMEALSFKLSGRLTIL
jgi:hypothetical protein